MIRISRHYISTILCLILAGDFAIFFASTVLTYWWGDSVGAGVFWPKATVLATMTLVFLYLADLYHFQLQFDKGELVLRVGLAALIAAGLTATIGYAIPSLQFNYLTLISLVVSSTIGITAFRLMARVLVSHQLLQQRVLVIGTEPMKAIMTLSHSASSVSWTTTLRLRITCRLGMISAAKSKSCSA